MRSRRDVSPTRSAMAAAIAPGEEPAGRTSDDVRPRSRVEERRLTLGKPIGGVRPPEGEGVGPLVLPRGGGRCDDCAAGADGGIVAGRPSRGWASEAVDERLRAEAPGSPTICKAASSMVRVATMFGGR